MVEIRRSVVVNAPIADVWAILRDFNGHDRWHPLVSSSEIEDGIDADRVGAVRRFTLRNGGQIREQLIALSDVACSFSYCIVEAPVFLRDYVAHVRLRPVTQDNSCLWQWSASFRPLAQERERLARFVSEDVIADGFRALCSLLSGEASRTSPPAPSTRPASPASGVEATAILTSTAQARLSTKS